MLFMASASRVPTIGTSRNDFIDGPYLPTRTIMFEMALEDAPRPNPQLAAEIIAAS